MLETKLSVRARALFPMKCTSFAAHAYNVFYRYKDERILSRKYARLFFIVAQYITVIVVHDEPGLAGKKGGQNSMEVQTSMYNEAESIAMFYKIFHRNVEECITLKK